MTWKTNKRSMQLGLFPQTDLVPGKGSLLRFRAALLPLVHPLDWRARAADAGIDSTLRRRLEY